MTFLFIHMHKYRFLYAIFFNTLVNCHSFNTRSKSQNLLIDWFQFDIILFELKKALFNSLFCCLHGNCECHNFWLHLACSVNSNKGNNNEIETYSLSMNAKTEIIMSCNKYLYWIWEHLVWSSDEFVFIFSLFFRMEALKFHCNGMICGQRPPKIEFFYIKNESKNDFMFTKWFKWRVKMLVKIKIGRYK